ncbi:MAG: GNAT family N-acetyltransferase [Clostridia bacterium]|nr:GNAT family N-acetyltransferase [Clostridia bacterium]
MTEYSIATKNDKQEIIDLIDYVFTYDYEPHDFKNLLPKVYADEVDGLGAKHYILKEDGVIKAVVAIRTMDVVYYGHDLKAGAVGSVAVHPSSRKKGYMSALMKFALEDAKKTGLQILFLSGKRQRYGYFGFENGGIVYNFTVSAANIKHALADVDVSGISYKEITNQTENEIKIACKLHNDRHCFVKRSEDEFLRVVKSWGDKPYAIYKNGKMIGYSVGILGELVLKDESDHAAVFKKMFEGLDKTTIKVASFERGRIEFLSAFCEDYSIRHDKKLCVLDWKSVLSVLLTLKSKTVRLTDGEAAFNIDGECISISVKNNNVTVVDIDEPATALSHNSAQRMFFELDGLLGGIQYGNWFPLPFYIDHADTF